MVLFQELLSICMLDLCILIMIFVFYVWFFFSKVLWDIQWKNSEEVRFWAHYLTQVRLKIEELFGTVSSIETFLRHSMRRMGQIKIFVAYSSIWHIGDTWTTPIYCLIKTRDCISPSFAFKSYCTSEGRWNVRG